MNGFKFHTESYGSYRATDNTGVCIKGSVYNETESDYYGTLVEVIELEFEALPVKRTVLFKCEWFDPTPHVGMVVHPRYKLVDVHDKKRFNKYEPFVLTVQASQVYYCEYPGRTGPRMDWKAVCKIKARAQIDIPASPSNDVIEPAFQNDDNDVIIEAVVGDEDVLLVASSEMDTSGDVDVHEHLIDNEEETSDEEEFENDVTTSEEEDEPDLDDSDENE